MSMLTTVAIIIMIAIAISLGVAVLIIRFSKEEDLKDNPILFNFMAGYCSGRAIGIQKSLKIGKGGRHIMKMSPRDVDPDNLNKLEDVDVIGDPNKIVTLTKGELSDEKNIKIILPDSADKFPEKLKNSDFGKLLMFYTELKNADKTEIGAFKEGMRRQADHIKEMGAGEASREHLVYMRELFQDALDAVIKDITKKERSSNYQSVASTHGTNPM